MKCDGNTSIGLTEGWVEIPQTTHQSDGDQETTDVVVTVNDRGFHGLYRDISI